MVVTFRQATPGDWSDVVARVARVLQEKVAMLHLHHRQEAIA